MLKNSRLALLVVSAALHVSLAACLGPSSKPVVRHAQTVRIRLVQNPKPSPAPVVVAAVAPKVAAPLPAKAEAPRRARPTQPKPPRVAKKPPPAPKKAPAATLSPAMQTSQSTVAVPAKPVPTSARAATGTAEAAASRTKSVGPEGIATAAATGAWGATVAAKYSDTYLQALRARIDQEKEYPALARSRHQAGRVEVGFTVLRSGAIEGLHVVNASPFTALNDAALAAVEAVRQFAPMPAELGRDKWALVVPIVFSLE